MILPPTPSGYTDLEWEWERIRRWVKGYHFRCRMGYTGEESRHLFMQHKKRMRQIERLLKTRHPNR